jgi:acyl carrier protein
MDRAEIRAKIKQIIYQVTNIAPEKIGDAQSYTGELALDSLSLMEIGVDVDYEFQLGLSDEAMRGLDSVDNTVALVERQLEKKAAGATSERVA